jgi:hypothetical protein
VKETLLFLVVVIRECFLRAPFLSAMICHSRERNACQDTTGGRQNAGRSALVSRTRSEGTKQSICGSNDRLERALKHHLPVNHYS